MSGAGAVWISALLLCVFCAPASAAIIAPQLQVTLRNGSPIIGTYKTSHSGRGLRAFQNIYYAEPPIGPLRFSDPVPRAPWKQPQVSTDAWVMCPQSDNFLLGGINVGQEDCLVIHVYTPLFPETNGLLPVIVYLHGGGFAAGTAMIYQPEYLVSICFIFD